MIGLQQWGANRAVPQGGRLRQGSLEKDLRQREWGKAMKENLAEGEGRDVRMMGRDYAAAAAARREKGSGQECWLCRYKNKCDAYLAKQKLFE